MTVGRIFTCSLLIAVVFSFNHGCSGREGLSPVMVLEELEAASGVEKPAKRIERLELFVSDHPDHPYRIQAYRRILETYVQDLDDIESAEGFLRGVLSKEKETWVRGELLFEKYSFLENADSLRAFEFVDTLLANEKYPRLFFYVGYMVGRHKGYEELARRCFEKAVSLSRKETEKAQIRSYYGSFLMRTGEKEKAVDVLKKASGYPTADAILADALWKDGMKEEALEYYIKYAAVMPGAREYVKLDSLYASVHGSTAGLETELMCRRLTEGGVLPDHSFFDINGRKVSLSDMRGRKLVLYVWSPT